MGVLWFKGKRDVREEGVRFSLPMTWLVSLEEGVLIPN